MTDTVDVPRGIFALPNEILLHIFNLLSTRELVPLTSTCHQFHSLILRLIHNRLQIAAGLNGSTLYLECNHPSARLTAARLFCTSLGTDGLDDLLSDIYDEHKYVGQIKRLGSMYSRFRPQKHEPDFRVSVRHPAGDIPGSRTYRDPNGAAAVPSDEDEIVRDTVTVDAHDLFSQLMTVAYLGKREWTKGLLISLQEIAEGTIRVWRDWLSKHCESRSFSDQSTVTIQQGTSAAKGKTRSDSVTDVHDPSQDPRVLWVNTRGNDVGVKFKVKRQKQRTTNMPLLFSSDVEVSVSYVVEFEEVYVRTAHLLLKLEEAETQLSNDSGKAIVFGSFRGPETVAAA